jgi:hypothetical protein
VAGGRSHDARDRRPLQRRDRAGQAASAWLSRARRRGARGDAPPHRRRGAAGALRGPGPGRGARAARVRARRDRGDGLLLLLPDRLGLRPLRQGERDRRRPRPRFGGGLDRLLQPQHHGPRPARQRSPLRALPQPGPQVDARHRHRLLGPRAGARDPLRGRPGTPPASSASTTAPATGWRS